jgi:hypothetical protein
VRAGADAGLEHFKNDSLVLSSMVTSFGSHTDRYGGAWVDAVTHAGRGIEIVPSLRLDVFDVRGQTVFAPEPRLAGRFRIAEGVSWISAFGVTHQVPTFVIPVPGADFSVFDTAKQSVWQASQSIEVAFPLRITAKATVFRNVSILSDVDGQSHDYGAELFLHRDFTERLGGFVSYTVSRSDRDQLGVEKLSVFDRTHVLSAVAGYDFGSGYRFGGRFFLASGRPYTVNCPTPDCSGGARPPMGTLPATPYTATGRFPMFARLDVRFEKKWSLGKGATIAATFEWFNSLLAREIDSVGWTPNGLAFSGRSPLTLPSVGVEGSY